MNSVRLNAARKTSTVGAYALAVVAVAVAVLARWLLAPLLGENVPFITLFLAVIVSAWYGGTGPGLVAAISGLVLAWYLFVPPPFSFAIEKNADAVALVVFFVTSASIAALGGRMRAAEQSARQQEALHRVTFASIGDAIVTTDRAGRVRAINQVAAELIGWSQQEVIGRALQEILHLVNEQTRQVVDNPVAKVLAHGHIVGLANHTVLIARDGTERAIDDSAAPIRGDDGQLIGVVMVFRDITERRRADLAVRRLAAIVETSDDAIIGKDLDGIVITWNQGAERIFGYCADEMIGKSITVLIPSERLGEEDEILTRMRRGERIDHYETVRVAKDGRRIDVSLSISPLRDSNGELIGISKIARDITNRKQTDAAWRESESRFSTFMQALPGLAWIKDSQGRYVFINDAAQKPFGMPKHELYGKTDGDLFAAETAAQFKANDEDAIRSRHGIQVIESLEHQDGLHYSIVSKFPIPDADGAPAFVGGVAIDITTRMRAEEALRQADRRKDEFLAILAHELRNPLAPIRNAVELLHAGPRDDEAMRAAVDMLDRQSAQMVRLIDDLLDVSRISRGKVELRRNRVELMSIVHQAVEAARPHCDEVGHKLTVVLPPSPTYVDGDAIRLTQVFGNLLNNACKFTAPGGEIQLHLERDDGHAVIRVKDTGIGIPADQLPHIFEMFSQVDTSLERSREGLGIGLSLVKSLVEMHGGTVEAHSQGVGQGSEFIVRLPAVGAETGHPVNLPEKTVEMPSAPRRILVVDDNQDAATSLGLLLKRLGHDVHMAHDGLQAVEEALAVRPHVILLDIGLPKLNGYDAGRMIREKCHDPIPLLVALTGWGQPDDRRRSEEAGFDAHLVKPVDFNGLTEILKRA